MEEFEGADIAHVIFERRRGDLWEWMKGKDFSLSSLMVVDKLFPDCVKLKNFGSEDILMGREQLQSTIPGDPDISPAAFPILEVFTVEDIQSMWGEVSAGISVTELLLGEPEFMLSSPAFAMLSENAARIRTTMSAMTNDRFGVGPDNKVLIQLIYRRVVERIFDMMCAYDFILRNSSHLKMILNTRRSFDSFGNEDLGDVMEAVSKFYKSKTRSECSSLMLRDVLIFMIDNERQDDSGFPQDWAGFESECIETLRKEGFSVTDTKRTGDFGADIVAQKMDLRYVIQCKWHGKPIGVSAVQEVVAARAHYTADYGAVVSRTRYTDAAHELARSNNIALLDADSLYRLDLVFD